MDAPAPRYRDLTPKKRRALVGSFVLGALVIAFFSGVLSVLSLPARRSAALGVGGPSAEHRAPHSAPIGDGGVSFAR
jgi:hypothetical protein